MINTTMKTKVIILSIGLYSVLMWVCCLMGLLLLHVTLRDIYGVAYLLWGLFSATITLSSISDIDTAIVFLLNEPKEITPLGGMEK
jgi:hypothetical protein